MTITEHKAQLDRYVADLTADITRMADYSTIELDEIVRHLDNKTHPLTEAIVAELDDRGADAFSAMYAGDGIFADNH